MTVYERKDFPLSDEIMALAIEAVRKSESFINQKENFEKIKDIDDEKYKKAFDENGNAIIEFNSGVYEDFDGDGKKEAFIILESYLCPPAYGEQYIYAVFVNSDGDVELFEEYFYSSYCVFRAIRYNGFMHMYIYYGDSFSVWNNNGFVYAVENGKAIPIWNPGSIVLSEKISDSIFINYAPVTQLFSDSLCFWNYELKKYCVLEVEEITTSEDMKALSEIGSELDDTFNFYIIGGKYYSIRYGTGIPSYITYEKENGEFVESEIKVMGVDGFSLNGLTPVIGINIDEAESKAIKINN